MVHRGLRLCVSLMTPERVSSEQHFNMVCLFHYCMCVVVHRLTLGRPSSPILLDKTTSPVVKDAPVDIGQVSIVCKSSVCVCVYACAHVCICLQLIKFYLYNTTDTIDGRSLSNKTHT